MALIRIAQWPEPIEAGRLRILEAALDAGVPYPHGCGSGECGGCKTRLLSGQVTLDRYSPDALSDEERAEGLILACRARVASDVQVRWLSSTAPLPMVKLQAQVAELRPVAHDVVVMSLELPAGATFAFRPGQFAKLRMGKLPARSYSMANQPGEKRLEFHVRVVDGGLVSSHVAQHLRVGDWVEVRGPFGDAYWEGHETPKHGPLLLLAGGTGLAPILSVLEAALGEGFPAEQIHVYHGVRGERDLYAGELLSARMREHGFRFVPVFSHAPSARARSGLLHEAVAEDFGDLAAASVHVAGPPPMVDAVKDMARRRGVAADRIRADAFFTAEPEKKTLWERLTGWGDL
jgi:CDP-4-dehydro-6-deoxyglucose reductase/ferredoxin-NAD(P)+ reductase (naphthalene dioxygenase ferredoxin-specific)